MKRKLEGGECEKECDRVVRRRGGVYDRGVRSQGVGICNETSHEIIAILNETSSESRTRDLERDIEDDACNETMSIRMDKEADINELFQPYQRLAEQIHCGIHDVPARSLPSGYYICNEANTNTLS